MNATLDAATIAKAAQREAAPPWKVGKDSPPDTTLTERYGAMLGGSAIALYDPSHPSVLFDKLRRGVLRGLGKTRFAKMLGGWIKKKPPEQAPKHSRVIGKEGGRRLLESGLVIPSQRDVFLLSRPHGAGEYLIDNRERQPFATARNSNLTQ